MPWACSCVLAAKTSFCRQSSAASLSSGSLPTASSSCICTDGAAAGVNVDGVAPAFLDLSFFAEVCVGVDAGAGFGVGRGTAALLVAFGVDGGAPAGRFSVSFRPGPDVANGVDGGG